MKLAPVEYFSYGLLLVFIIIFIALPIPKYPLEKVTYCHIDSVSANDKAEFTSEIKNKYWTDCGYVFTSKKTFLKGNSIKVRTIIVE
jgi:hypothetical protein